MAKKPKDVEAIRTRFLPVEDREDVDEKYEAIVAYCQHFKTTFRDGEFPIDSFPRKDKMIKRALRFITGGYLHDARWTRPIEYLKCTHSRNITLNEFNYLPVYELPAERTLIDNLMIDHVCQTKVPNCGLVAAMASLAEFPQALRALFPKKELSEYGVYEVRLCVFGGWKSILIDDWLWMRSTRLLTAGSIEQLWPSLIEKALAKVRGGYLALRGISAIDSYRTLTGQPTMAYITQEMTEDQLWEALVNAKTAGFPMSTSTNRLRNRLMTRLRVRSRHYYSLIDVKLWRGHRLVRLRNTWGSGWWRGQKWSLVRNSGKVETDEDLKDLCGDKGEVFGSRWLKFEHFKQCFKLVAVCRLRLFWTSITVNTTVGGTIDNRNKAIQITLSETTDVCFSATDLKNCERSRLHTLVSLCRCRSDSDDVDEPIHCFYMVSSIAYSSEDVRLEPGNYLVMTTAVSQSRMERNIIIHSSKPLHARLVPMCSTALIGSFQQFIHRFGKEIQLDTQDVHPEVSIKKCWLSNGLLMVMAENYSSDRYLHVSSFFKNSKISSHRFHTWLTREKVFSVGRVTDDIPSVNSGEHFDVVPPMSRQILLTQYDCVFWRKRSELHIPRIGLQYYFSSEDVAKIWGKKRQHLPSILPTMYIFHTLAIDEN